MLVNEVSVLKKGSYKQGNCTGNNRFADLMINELGIHTFIEE